MKDGRASRVLLALGFAAALLLRLGFLQHFRENADMRGWRAAAEIIHRGGTVYSEAVRYNYAPVWAYVLSGLSLAASGPRAFAGAVLALFFVADLAIAVVVYRLALALGRSVSAAAGAALLFFANPVSVFGSSFFAQFDSLAVLFLILAILAAVSGRPITGAGALSASLLVKHLAWFHPLLFALRREGRFRGWPVSLASYALFFASFLPFWRARREILQQVFAYRGMGEPYGLEFLRFLPGFPQWGTTAIFVAASFSAVVLLRRVELARASLMLFLVTLLFLPGVSPYYFVWPVALGSVFGGAGYFVYTVVLTGFFVHSPDGLGVAFAHLPGWPAVWWSTAFWLLWEVRRLGPKGELRPMPWRPPISKELTPGDRPHLRTRARFPRESAGILRWLLRIKR